MKFINKYLILIMFFLVLISISSVDACDLNASNINSSIIYDEIPVNRACFDDECFLSSNLNNTISNHNKLESFNDLRSNDSNSIDNKSIITSNGVYLTAADVEMYFKGNETYKVTLMSENGPIVGEIVHISINSKTYDFTTDNNGCVFLQIGLSKGQYDINAYYNGQYGFASINNTITVKTTIQGSETVLYYRNGTSYNVCVIDSQGKTVTSNKVRFNINGIYYDIDINNGTASLPIGLNAGNYIITASNPINGELTSNNITVLSTIFGENIELYYRNGTNYTVKAIDGQGNPVKEGKVSMNINGVLYNVVTNASGVASLPIGLNAGNYIITACNPINGELTSNNITVLSTIFGENIELYYRNGTNYTVKAIDGQGNPVKEGNISMNINGVFYSVNVVNGTASLPIGLNPETYIITAQNPVNNELTSNIITVLSTIIGNDIVVSNLPGNYTVFLLDGQGMPLTNNNVTMNINGVMYERPILDGEAFLLINLTIGEYKITVKNPINGELHTDIITCCPVTPSILNQVNTITNLAPYLAQTKNCQVNAVVIQNLAAELTEGTSNDYEKAVAIFDYVRDSLSYSYYYNTKKGAVKTLISKSGNCCDHSHLLIALSRAAGLPARYNHGTCDFNGETYGHVWAQILVGNLWIVADAISSQNSFGVVKNWNNYSYKLHSQTASLAF